MQIGRLINFADSNLHESPTFHLFIACVKRVLKRTFYYKTAGHRAKPLNLQVFAWSQYRMTVHRNIYLYWEDVPLEAHVYCTTEVTYMYVLVANYFCQFCVV